MIIEIIAIDRDIDLDLIMNHLIYIAIARARAISHASVRTRAQMYTTYALARTHVAML